jgi:hypothetical protein
MSHLTKPISNATLKKALFNCIGILKPCAELLRSVDDSKLEKHIKAISLCQKDCIRALSAIENNPEQLREAMPILSHSLRKCIVSCRQIKLDIFQEAIVALEDCLGEF